MPEEKKTQVDSVARLAVKNAKPESSRDPLRIMVEIAENQNLSVEDRAYLIQYSRDRFKNRQFMAYLCLSVIILSLVFLYVGAFVDGLSPCVQSGECAGVLSTVKNNQTLIIWINGFLAAIVGAYYGVSALRPSS